MLRFAFFLLFLTLAAGCLVEDKPVTPPDDGGVDSGIMCGTVICPEDRPLCSTDLMCVQCTAEDDDYCAERGLICELGSFTCVGCSSDSDCTDPTAARCDNNVCTQCTEHSQCADITGIGAAENACHEGVCVDCTPETETETCPDPRTCNPRTQECTDVSVGSLEVCEECVSDSQCGDEGDASDAHRCVPMFYGPEDVRFPNDEVGFCLKSIELGGMCINPFRIPLTRTSLSGAEADDYCGINEELATCPAVRALLEDQDCNPANGDADCPQPSGLCRELPGTDQHRCTYFCASDHRVFGRRSRRQPGSTCGSSGSGGDDYCGG